MDDARSRSLILVVSRTIAAPYHTSFIRLETPILNHEYAYSSVDVQEFQSGFSAHIPDIPGFSRSRICWVFSPPLASSSTEDLYMFPDLTDLKHDNLVSFPGLVFNLSTKKCKIIKPPLSRKGALGYALTIGDHIYFTAQASMHSSLAIRFERYDTLKQSWKELEPLPVFGDENLSGGYFWSRGQYILGTAVVDDTILFNMDTYLIRAYNVGRNKWYNVTVLSNECYCVKGESVVLNKSIYGLYGESVVKLTLSSKENNDGDLEYTFDLLKMYAVPGILEMKLERLDSYWNKHLVHLGEDNFCVVRRCDSFRPECQVIQITYIELSEKRSIVTKICLHEFKIPDGDIFDVLHCISLPNCKATALKEGSRFNPEHEAEIVTLPPELVPPYLDKHKSQSNIIAKQGGGSVSQSSQSADTTPEVLEEDVPKISSVRSNTDEEGHSICVRNLPLDFNARQLEKVLKKFGPIKSIAIHTDFSHMNGCWFADVEYESKTSKQNAIEASPITIGGRRIAVIEKKRGTGLTQDRVTPIGQAGSRSSGSNEVKNHGKDSRSKKSCNRAGRRGWIKGLNSGMIGTTN